MRITQYDPLKQRARKDATLALRRGEIQRSPCSECGEPDSEMHHTDYNKPLDIIWLCKPCHRKRHKGQKRNRLTKTAHTLAVQAAILTREMKAQDRAAKIAAKAARQSQFAQISPITAEMSALLRAYGAAGGKKGGAARWAGVSKKARSRAMKAVRAKGKVKE